MSCLAHLVCASLDDIRGEVRQLLEEGVFGPHGLGDHLSQLHGSESRLEPAIAAENIHTRLDQPHSLKGVE